MHRYRVFAAKTSRQNFTGNIRSPVLVYIVHALSRLSMPWLISSSSGCTLCWLVPYSLNLVGIVVSFKRKYDIVGKIGLTVAIVAFVVVLDYVNNS